MHIPALEYPDLVSNDCHVDAPSLMFNRRWVNAGIWVNGLLRRRWLRTILQVLVVASCVIFLAAHLRGTTLNIESGTMNFAWLMAAWAIATANVFVGAGAWWFILKGFGQPISWHEAARIHVNSNMAKYVPGYAWQMVGKAFLTRQWGVPSRTVGLSMLFEMGELVAIGSGLALSLGPTLALERWALFGLPTEAVRGIGLIILVGACSVVLWPRRHVYRTQETVGINRKYLLAAVMIMLSGWLLLAFAYLFIAASLQQTDITLWPLFLFTLTISMVAGLVVIIVPGGIGVRESVMVVLLVPYITSPVAVIIAALSRVILILSDLAAAGLVSLAQRGISHADKQQEEAIPPG